MTAGREQGWSRHVVSLVDYLEFGTVFEVAQFGVDFAEGISAVVPFAPVVHVPVAFEICLMNEKQLLNLDYLPLTTQLCQDRKKKQTLKYTHVHAGPTVNVANKPFKQTNPLALSMGLNCYMPGQILEEVA